MTEYLLVTYDNKLQKVENTTVHARNVEEALAKGRAEILKHNPDAKDSTKIINIIDLWQ